MSTNEHAARKLSELRDAHLNRALNNPQTALGEAIRHLNHANMRMMSEVLELLCDGTVPASIAMQAAEVLAANSAKIADAALAYRTLSRIPERSSD